MRQPILLGLVALMTGGAAPMVSPPEWSRPAEPFHVAGPIYHVGTEGIAVYLIKTDDGLILLDAGLEESVPVIEGNIAKLGFQLSDVKLMLATHAHFDHAEGLAALKRSTGARFASSDGDRRAYETGTPPSEVDYGLMPFPPIKVDQVLVDGRALRLGDITMTPVITPGHTAGCTTWRMQIASPAGRPLDVVFPCSISVAGNKLVGNKGYPGIVDDFRRTFARLRALDADIVLPAHPEPANLRGRAAMRDAGDANAFVAPDLLPAMVDKAEADFERQLKVAGSGR